MLDKLAITFNIYFFDLKSNFIFAFQESQKSVSGLVKFLVTYFYSINNKSYAVIEDIGQKD